MGLALQLYDVYGESLFGFAGKKCGQVNASHMCPPHSRAHVIFCVAGFRPGRRGPFVPAKGPKTIDAPSDLIGVDGR